MSDEPLSPVERALARIDAENRLLQALQEQPDDATPWEWVLYECGRANRPQGSRPFIRPDKITVRSLFS